MNPAFGVASCKLYQKLSKEGGKKYFILFKYVYVMCIGNKTHIPSLTKGNNFEKNHISCDIDKKIL